MGSMGSRGSRAAGARCRADVAAARRRGRRTGYAPTLKYGDAACLRICEERTRRRRRGDGALVQARRDAASAVASTVIAGGGLWACKIWASTPRVTSGRECTVQTESRLHCAAVTCVRGARQEW